MAKRLVCICNLVEEKEIKALLDMGVTSVKEIQDYTRAGSTCGKCLPVIDDILNTHKKKEPKDQQKKLDFGF